MIAAVSLMFTAGGSMAERIRATAKKEPTTGRLHLQCGRNVAALELCLLLRLSNEPATNQSSKAGQSGT